MIKSVWEGKDPCLSKNLPPGSTSTPATPSACVSGSQSETLLACLLRPDTEGAGPGRPVVVEPQARGAEGSASECCFTSSWQETHTCGRPLFASGGRRLASLRSLAGGAGWA